MPVLTVAASQTLFSKASVVLLIVGIVIILMLLMAYIKDRDNYTRVKNTFVRILLNEKRLSVPNHLAIEVIDALGSPQIDNIVVDIYRNHENCGWVDLVIRNRGLGEQEDDNDLSNLIAKAALSYDTDEQQVSQESVKERVDSFVATASGKNYGEVILKYLL